MLAQTCLMPPARLLMLSRLLPDLWLRPAQAAVSVWLRLVLCVLSCCIGLQTVAVAAHRAQGRAHFHIGKAKRAPVLAEAPVLHDSPHGHAIEPGPAALFRHKSSLHDDHSAGPTTAPHHTHTGLAHHDHDDDDASVVHVAQDERHSGSGAQAALSTVVHDLDGLLPACVPLSRQLLPDRWPPFASTAITSHVTQPLERPPQG